MIYWTEIKSPKPEPDPVPVGVPVRVPVSVPPSGIPVVPLIPSKIPGILNPAFPLLIPIFIIPEFFQQPDYSSPQPGIAKI